jgi:hypothetical protein
VLRIFVPLLPKISILRGDGPCSSASPHVSTSPEARTLRREREVLAGQAKYRKEHMERREGWAKPKLRFRDEDTKKAEEQSFRNLLHLYPRNSFVLNTLLSAVSWLPDPKRRWACYLGSFIFNLVSITESQGISIWTEHRRLQVNCKSGALVRHSHCRKASSMFVRMYQP